jgi:hypothetical protein
MRHHDDGLTVLTVQLPQQRENLLGVVAIEIAVVPLRLAVSQDAHCAPLATAREEGDRG